MSKYGLFICDRNTSTSRGYWFDITRHAVDWTRSIRSQGGFWTGDFTITDATMSSRDIMWIYETAIGKQIFENTGGMITWEGEVVEMTLSRDGIQFTITLNPERWHNYVAVNYGHAVTAASENTGSSDLYGECQYIDYVGTAYTATAAVARRDRRLLENAFPRSRATGGLSTETTEQLGSTSLHVVAAGYCLGMNRRYQTTDVAAANVSTQIATLVGNSEFVTMGGYVTNTLQVPITAAGINPRLWDLIQELMDMGDASGVKYAGGVWENRYFRYDKAETGQQYIWLNGKLYDTNQNLVLPTMARPDIIVQILGPTFSPNTVNALDINKPQNVYVEEVEFRAPNGLTLIPEGSY